MSQPVSPPFAATPDPKKPARVAIVGAGISGLAAADAIGRHTPWDVTLFETRERLGGHAHTHQMAFPGEAEFSVDTGFIVCNNRNYPNFRNLLTRLDVDLHPTEMSFSVSLTEAGERGSFEYSGGTLSGLFVQRRNLLRPAHWLLLREIARFNREAKAATKSRTAREVRTGDWLEERGFGDPMVTRYLLPMTGAIWSSSPSQILDFPVSSMFHFMDNHGLLDFVNRPQWYSLRGGSHTYVRALASACRASIEVGKAVTQVAPRPDGTWVSFEGRNSERFDAVLMACHADDALRLLSDPDALEREILGAFHYSNNHVFLHSDARFMPRRRAAWAAWNYLGSGTGESAPIAVTYWMNALQDLQTERLMLVTLNPNQTPANVHRELVYRHPQFDQAAVAAQKKRPQIQGHRNVWYAGAHWRWGFHEDGVVSGITAVRSMGVDVPMLGEMEAA